MNAWQVGTPIHARGVTLVPVERVQIVATGRSRALGFNATKEVVALVICGSDGPRAVDMNARDIPLRQVMDAVPGLQQALAEFEPCRPGPDDVPRSGKGIMSALADRLRKLALRVRRG